jgi:hypothetical protein
MLCIQLSVISLLYQSLIDSWQFEVIYGYIGQQGVIFPAGARALPTGNPQISQEILIIKSYFKSFFWKK